jgi:type II secretory pathway component PulF
MRPIYLSVIGGIVLALLVAILYLNWENNQLKKQLSPPKVK